MTPTTTSDTPFDQAPKELQALFEDAGLERDTFNSAVELLLESHTKTDLAVMFLASLASGGHDEDEYYKELIHDAQERLATLQ
jgi:hypothetical protein